MPPDLIAPFIDLGISLLYLEFVHRVKFAEKAQIGEGKQIKRRARKQTENKIKETFMNKSRDEYRRGVHEEERKIDHIL
jgi:hypothetical protein